MPTFEYGTAGFRCKADLLDEVMYRMGILAVLRSKLLQASIGVMVTASHNPEEDNGVKLVDPGGEMMEESWEVVANRMANATQDGLEKLISDIITTHHIPSTPSSHSILVAMDTRPSSSRLLSRVVDGVKKMGGSCRNYDELTTPQLHYMVRCINSKHHNQDDLHHHHHDHHLHDNHPNNNHPHDNHPHNNSYYGEATEEGYVLKLTSAYLLLCQGQKTTKTTLHVDGANGVGAKKLASISSRIGNILELKLFNDGTQGKLNHMCGADYVKSNQRAPANMHTDTEQLCCSFDGDADRVVFYCHDNQHLFHLLDGDKIAVLLADFVNELMTKTGLKFRLGIVQTAYANGASTNYITQHVNIPVTCTPTGVKNLHKAAILYDIGVYFEANGHGTIVYKEAVQAALKETAAAGCSADVSMACQDFLSFIQLTNQTVGDAISDMLLVEVVLRRKGWGVEEWRSLYTDLPNKLIKIKVRDRGVIETVDAERRVSKPSSLQPIINSLVAALPSGRSFARPSGTEDVVRVYAEAATQEEADRLAWHVACAVYEEAGGVGAKPLLS